MRCTHRYSINKHALHLITTFRRYCEGLTGGPSVTVVVPGVIVSFAPLFTARVKVLRLTVTVTARVIDPVTFVQVKECSVFLAGLMRKVQTPPEAVLVSAVVEVPVSSALSTSILVKVTR